MKKKDIQSDGIPSWLEEMELNGWLHSRVRNGQREYKLTKLGKELYQSPGFKQAFPQYAPK